uniref:protein polybromo-1-like isoform X2 n=1 Tax=Styela clava TaxID=7725 RepID=UPI00193A5320|nr:protein polybromo-1-like isoform X2 [Styela clava]
MPPKRKLPRDGTTQESPYSKRSRRTKPNQTDIAEKILETLKSHQKEDGSNIANSFLKVPSKRQNPDYHETVREPIDLTRITQRMKMDEYRDIESLTADMDLLVNNAKKYYDDDSAEYKDANALWELYLDTKSIIMSNDAPEEQQQTVGQGSEEVMNKLDDIFNSLLAEVDDEGQGLTDMFMLLPDSKVYPDYYQKIKDPIDLTTIGNKIQNKEYKNINDFEKDLKQLIKNARSYNEPNSKIYNNAVALKNALQDRLQSETEIKIEKSDPGVKTSARIKQRISAKFDPDTSLKRQDAVDETSVRSSRATILHQASITDTRLKGKEALQAKLYNVIVNYRNPLGHSISDAFVRLPNKHQHPSYYEEIENPITFKAIKKNIIAHKYKSLDEFAEDCRLLFSNAMHYNKEGSVIYKNAQTLKQLMEDKLPENKSLEDELEDSEQDEEEEEEEEDEEEEEEEEEDVDDEEEEVEDELYEGSTPDSKKGRKRRDSLKSKGSGQKEKPQDMFRKNLRSLYDAVLDGTYESRSMIGLFMEKPSRKDYPDYYKLILEPIDMKTIDKKLRQDKYPTVYSLVEDFMLMFTNARHYNEPGSEVYQDADRLQEILRKKQEEFPASEIQDDGKMTPVPVLTKEQAQRNPLLKCMDHIYQKVRNFRDPTGREICEIFNKLPSKSELPDYYQVIKRPMDNDKIHQKMMANSYLSLSEFMADMLLMFENACTYNEPGSLIYKDALILQKVAVDAHDDYCIVTKQAPNIQSKVEDILINIFVSVINCQDEDGRCYSDTLHEPAALKKGTDTPIASQEISAEPATEAMDVTNNLAPDTAEENFPKPDEDTITLDVIRRNLHAKRYRRLDVFQEHMFHVFETARKNNRTDSEVYEDAVELQKFFIRYRDQLCKNGEILSSPALAYTSKILQNELDVEKQEKLPGEELEDEEGKNEGKEMREKVQLSTASDGMDVKGVTYQAGDFVYVEDTEETSSGNHPPHIACIEKLYQDESGQQRMYGVWFFRPQETYHLQTRKFLMKEVFKSDYYNTVPVSSIKGKCFVMIGKDYFKQKPVGYLEDDVYVCVSRYSSRMKSFKRIKLLNLPQNNTKIINREKALVPVRVSSVYSENSKAMETPKLSDMHGPLVTDDLPWPTVVIHKKRQNIKFDNATQENKPPVSQTFYLQYNINNLCLKVGDSVYVQQQHTGSDQRLKIARIESMWSDANNVMWFQGSWFAQPCDTSHEPTRMFFKNEVFLLSFNSPYGDEATASMPPPTPLSWVVGVCAVMSVRELSQCRPTEILEMHIHVCESRYLAADKFIKKIKGGSLKKPASSNKVVDDEMYYLKKPLEISKEISPILASSVKQELREREIEFAKEKEEELRRKTMQVQQVQGVPMPQQYPQQMMPQPGPQRQYPAPQYQAYPQHPYQQLQQPYVAHPPQQQYMAPPNQPQVVPIQQPYQQHQFPPGTPYVAHTQMITHHGVPSPAPQQMQPQPQMQQQYMQPPIQYTPAQPGIPPHMVQSPMQPGMRQTNTPIDRVETPSSSTTGTPTTKKKNRGGHSTGYILFASECHPRMRAENPTMPFGDISKLVGEEWRSQTDEKKREYEEKARELSAKAEAEGRPMQGKRRKKQQLKREMEEAAAAAQQQQQLQQQQHPPPQPHMVVQQQQQMMLQQPYNQAQYHPGQQFQPQQGYQPSTPQQGTPQQYQPGQTPQMVSTPGPAPGQVYATPVNATTDQNGYSQQPGSGMRRGPLFVKPPPKVQRVLHSEAYLRYIDSLEKGNRTISNFEKTLSVEEKDVEMSVNDMAKLPAHWLANGQGRHASIKSALWSLRDLMLKDALAIKNHFL